MMDADHSGHGPPGRRDGADRRLDVRGRLLLQVLGAALVTAAIAAVFLGHAFVASEMTAAGLAAVTTSIKLSRDQPAPATEPTTTDTDLASSPLPMPLDSQR